MTPDPPAADRPRDAPEAEALARSSTMRATASADIGGRRNPRVDLHHRGRPEPRALIDLDPALARTRPPQDAPAPHGRGHHSPPRRQRLTSERTRDGLARARARAPEGVLGVSRLDGKEDEIRRVLELGVSKTAIAKLTRVARTALYSFITTRGLRPSP